MTQAVQKSVGAVGRRGLLRLDRLGGQVRHGRVHVLDLDDEVAQAAGLDRAVRRVVDELEGDELVAGELQHRQGAELGAGHLAEHLVAEGGVERDRPLEVGDPQADVQRPRDSPCRVGPREARSRVATGGRAWSTRVRTTGRRGG